MADRADVVSLGNQWRAARMRNGGFKRLLQQELLDQFDRLSKL